jgi:hypothetical protein
VSANVERASDSFALDRQDPGRVKDLGDQPCHGFLTPISSPLYQSINSKYTVLEVHTAAIRNGIRQAGSLTRQHERGPEERIGVALGH